LGAAALCWHGFPGLSSAVKKPKLFKSISAKSGSLGVRATSAKAAAIGERR
jgi:hypothetical protein